MELSESNDVAAKELGLQVAAVAVTGIHLVGTLEFEATAAQTEARVSKDGLCSKVDRWDKEG